MFGFVLYRGRSVSGKALRAVFIVICITLVGYLSVAKNAEVLLSEKFGFVSMGLAKADVWEMRKAMPNMAARFDYWKYYSKGIVTDYNSFLWGHPKRPDRSKYPSAHNYILDFVYNFGLLALLPLLAIMGYTILLAGWHRQVILSSSGLLGLTLVVLFLLFVENWMKVGLRQPYPGILTFFLWGIMISRLSYLTPVLFSKNG